MFTIARVFTVRVFCKIFKKYPTHAQWIRLFSVYSLAFRLYANFIDFEDPINICLEIVVWKI